MNQHLSSVTLAVAVALGSAAPSFAQDAAASAQDELAEIVVTGTRVANRSALDTVAPVDVVSSQALNNVGVTEISQACRSRCPR
jgi:iron complex outermembrane receptor protein